MDVDLVFKIGKLTSTKFRDFIETRTWQCSHCKHESYLIEEYGNTEQCAVSSMPYIAASNEGNWSITGSGSPSYTVLCANCFAVTKYNAHEVIKAIEGHIDD